MEKSFKGRDIETDIAPIGVDDIRDSEGYIVDARALAAASPSENKGIKIDKDGRTILIPQPSDDTNDPLNWSVYKKHLILIIVSMAAFLPEYGSTVGVVTSIPQAKVWHIPQNTVLHSQAGNVFMNGAGSVFVVALAAYFGRYPVMTWFLVFTLWTAAWSAASHTFPEFMASRILNGFFAPVSQAGALIFIGDMFFLHEHARKINIWCLFLITSPYIGPLTTSFELTKLSWQWPFWVYTILVAVVLILVVSLLEETFYDRRIPIEDQPVRKSRAMRVIGVEQFKSRHQRNTVLGAIMRPAKAISKPTVFISCIYYFCTYAWVVGINNTLTLFLQPVYHFGAKQIGFFYFAPIVAVICGFILGHWIHDVVASVSARRNNGKLEPEARLWVMWLSTPIMMTGLIVLGFALQKHMHYMVAAVGWGLFVFGIVITTVGLNAYNLSSYPEGAGEVSAWINFARMTGGFMVTYVQVEWATKVGTAKSFGTQAGIVVAVFVLLIIPMQFYGKRLRQWAGPLNFNTN